MLVITAGLPGTGQSTVCRPLARRTGAVHLRIDTIEQAVVHSGLAQHPVGPVGYSVGHALTRDFLRQGLSVVIDCVNPLALTRNAWRQVADDFQVPVLEVEVVCSDVVEHRRRAESRPEDIPGLVWPTWREIMAREYETWTRDRLIIDTATVRVPEAVERLTLAMQAAES